MTSSTTGRPETADRWFRPVPCTIVGMVGNSLLTVGKILVGMMAQSASLVADGFHSLADLAGDVGILLALKVSNRPADTKHPYGHHNIETLGALGASLLLVTTGVLIGRSAVIRLLSGEHLQPQPAALVAALVAIGVKEAMARYTFRAGHLNNSPALRANAANHRSDALSSLAAAVGIGGGMLGWPILDSLVALIIAAIISKMGLDLVRENALALMDTMPGEEVLEGIRSVAATVPGTEGVSELRVRQRGSTYMADVSITVDPDHTVEAGHEIAHQVEVALLRDVANLAKVFVHIEPAPRSDFSGGAPTG